LAKSKLELKNIIILSCRVEKSEPFDVDLITSRALSSAKILISLVAKFIKKDTKLLLYKGDVTAKEAFIKDGKYYCSKECMLKE